MIGSNRVPSAMRLLAVANMLVSVGYVSAIPEELLAVKEKEPPERRSLFELKGVSRRVDPARRVRRTEVKQRFNTALKGREDEEKLINELLLDAAEPVDRLQIYNIHFDPAPSMSMATKVPQVTNSPVQTTSPPTLAPIDYTDVELPTASPSYPPTSPTTTLPTFSPTTSSSELPSTLPSSTPTTPTTLPPTNTPNSPPTPVPTTTSPTTTPPTLSPTNTPTNPPTPAPTTTSPTFSPSLSGEPSFSSSLSPSLLPTVTSPSLLPTFTSPSLLPTFTCNLDPETRSATIKEALAEISDSDALQSTGTAQYKAQEWIINEDTNYTCPQSPNFLQRYASAVLYYSTEGDSWTKCNAPKDFKNVESIEEANDNCYLNGKEQQAWLTPSSECLWGGIVCNEDLYIESIDIENNGLAGSLPSELMRLSMLRYLLLEDGKIAGTIPSELGNLRFLEKIDLNYNSLQGEIPTEIYSLTTLNELDLNDNNLTGIISTLIGQLTNLSLFSVEYNMMRGTIPVELGKLDLLRFATFDHNQFSGSVPQEVCKNRDVNGGNLQVLSVDCLGGSVRDSPPYVECSGPFDDPVCCSQCQ